MALLGKHFDFGVVEFAAVVAAGDFEFETRQDLFDLGEWGHLGWADPGRAH